jgi:hypothetical protein
MSNYIDSRVKASLIPELPSAGGLATLQHLQGMMAETMHGVELILDELDRLLPNRTQRHYPDDWDNEKQRGKVWYRAGNDRSAPNEDLPIGTQLNTAAHELPELWIAFRELAIHLGVETDWANPWEVKKITRQTKARLTKKAAA